MATYGIFESPLCNHRFTKDQLNSFPQVRCDCGYVFDSALALKFLAEEEKIDTAKSWLANAQVALESIKMQLIGDATRNLASTASQPNQEISRFTVPLNGAPVNAETVPSVASAAVTTAPPRKVTPPPLPAKPKRAPLSPRAILLIVAGTLTLIGVSAGLATTWSVLPDWAKAAVVLFLVFAAGFGAVKARNFIRALANFLAILSSSLLLLGLYAEALLNPGLHDAGATDAGRSLYVPICLLVVSAASAWAGRKFQVNGWLFLPTIGVAVSSALTALAFVPRIGHAPTENIVLASNGSWQLLAISLGGMLTAYAGRLSKVSIPSFEKPTSEQEFALLEITRESNASRQIVRLSYLAALAQLTIVTALIGIAGLSGHRPDYAGLLALGSFWVFGAWFLETRGAKFTSSGVVSSKVIWGAWILGFGALAVAAGSWPTSLDETQKANYLSASIAALIGAGFALSQNIIPLLRKYPIGKSVSRAASWLVWSSWLVSTDHLSLANSNQVGVLVIHLIAVSATWFAVRRIENTARFQVHSITPAAISAVIWALASQAEYGPNPYQLAVISATHLIFSSVLLAATGYLTLRINKRAEAVFPLAGASVINTANVLVALGVLVTRHFELLITHGYSAADDFWPLFLAALILASGRLASIGASIVSEDKRVRRMALVGAISLLALPYLQLVIASISSSLEGSNNVLIVVTLLELAVISAYAFWQRSEGFALSILPLATILSIATSVAIYDATVHNFAVAFVAIPAMILAAFTIGAQLLVKLRVKQRAELLAGSAVVLMAITILSQFFIGLLSQHGWISPAKFSDGGDLNATVNAASLVVFGGFAFFGTKSKWIASLPESNVISTGFGWIALAASPVIALYTDAPTSQNGHVRLMLTLIAITAILVARSKIFSSLLSRTVAFWTGALAIWVSLETLAISTAARQESFGTLLMPQIGVVATLLFVLWHWALNRLSPEKTPTRLTSRVSQLEAAIYIALLVGLLQLSHLTHPILQFAENGATLTPEINSLQWHSMVVGTVVLGVMLWVRLRGVLAGNAPESSFRPLFAVWFSTMIMMLNSSWTVLNDFEIFILAITLFVDGYFSHRRASILIGFAASVFSGWAFASRIFYELHFPLSQLFNFAAIASFVLATWLLSRNPKGFNLDSWSIVLPIVSGVSMFLGLVYRFIFFAYDAQRIGGWLLEVEWAIALTLAIAYLFISKHRVLESMKRARRSAVFSSAFSWFLAWPIVLSSSMNTRSDSLRIMIFSLISIAALFTFAAKFKTRRALYFGYVVGLPFAIGLSQLTRWAFNWIEPQTEIFALALTLVSVAGTVVYRRSFGVAKTSDYSLGIPVLAALLPSTIQTIFVSNVKISEQSDAQIWRFVILNVLAALTLVAGVRIGKRGLVWPTTAVLLLGLVPNLYYRIEDVFPDVRVQAEMKALLFATTVYVLIYLVRKTQKLAIPSVVAVGVPAVISISVLFVDTLGALQQNTLDSGDWIRFLVLIVVGTAFLTLGAIRKIAGLFYPGIVAVLVAAIPYAWQKTNYGSWVVLLLLAGLIVWVAIRLERFTGWLKELK